MKKIVVFIGVFLIFDLKISYAQIGEEVDLLSRIVSKTQYDSIAIFINRYENIRTDDQFYQFYHDILIFKEELSRAIDDSLKINKNGFTKEQIEVLFKDKIKILKLLGNEIGYPFYLQLNNDLLIQKSNETIGENDNSFMEIVYAAYGEKGEMMSHSLPFWIHERSYVSISSRLGDYSNLNFYKKLKREVGENKLFKDELLVLAAKFKNDLTIYSAFDHKKVDVIKELRKIQKFDNSLKQEIDTYISEINTSSSFQFNCNNCDCRFEN